MDEVKIFKVTSNPILRTERSTRQIMLDVIIGLLPALAVAVYMFGANVVMLLAVSIVSCVFFEWGYRKLMKKNTIPWATLSAVVTAILLVCVLPSEAKWWMVVIGAFFSVVVVKQLYGGIGKNFLNPALAGRAFLTAGVCRLHDCLGGPGGSVRKCGRRHDGDPRSPTSITAAMRSTCRSETCSSA